MKEVVREYLQLLSLWFRPPDKPSAFHSHSFTKLLQFPSIFGVETGWGVGMEVWWRAGGECIGRRRYRGQTCIARYDIVLGDGASGHLYTLAMSLEGVVDLGLRAGLDCASHALSYLYCDSHAWQTPPSSPTPKGRSNLPWPYHPGPTNQSKTPS